MLIQSMCSLEFHNVIMLWCPLLYLNCMYSCARSPSSYSLSSVTNFHPLSSLSIFCLHPVSLLLSSSSVLHSLIGFCPLSNFLWFGRCVCPCLPFFPMCCLFGDKPRERDFLKTLRLVSGTEACAVEQHGDTVDDDKGVRVACPPHPHPLLTD